MAPAPLIAPASSASPVSPAPPMPGAAAVVNGLSIDVEDWYQGFDEIPRARWPRYESRLAGGVERVLAALDERGVKATFFVLGYNAARHPGLVRLIAAAGHELGTHGYDHRLVYAQTPAAFREGTRRSIGLLEDIAGAPVVGHRAAFFSITPRAAWALDVLIELGLRYDSSIFPIRHFRYGWPGAPGYCCRVRRPAGTIVELPLPTLGRGPLRLPVVGGAYGRILPPGPVHAGLRRLNRAGRPFIIYLHPWELDPGQPRLGAWRPTAWLHYANLGGTAARFARLLREFRFAPLRDLAASGALPLVELPR